LAQPTIAGLGVPLDVIGQGDLPWGGWAENGSTMATQFFRRQIDLGVTIQSSPAGDGSKSLGIEKSQPRIAKLYREQVARPQPEPWPQGEKI